MINIVKLLSPRSNLLTVVDMVITLDTYSNPLHSYSDDRVHVLSQFDMSNLSPKRQKKN